MKNFIDLAAFQVNNAHYLKHSEEPSSLLCHKKAMRYIVKTFCDIDIFFSETCRWSLSINAWTFLTEEIINASFFAIPGKHFYSKTEPKEPENAVEFIVLNKQHLEIIVPTKNGLEIRMTGEHPTICLNNTHEAKNALNKALKEEIF